MLGPEHAGHVVDLIGPREIQHHQQATLAGMVAGQIGEVVEKLLAIGQAADRIDPAEGVLQFDLRHRHRRKIAQRRHFVGSCLARFGAEHAQRPQTIAVARDKRRTRVEPRPVLGEPAVRIGGMGEQVGYDQCARRLRDLGAGCPVTVNLGARDPDPRHEPLAILVGQRYRCDRQPEDLARHPRNPVEAFARRDIEDVELSESVESCRFCRRVSHDSHRRHYDLS